jgi:hypothetical protein
LAARATRRAIAGGEIDTAATAIAVAVIFVFAGSTAERTIDATSPAGIIDAP